MTKTCKTCIWSDLLTDCHNLSNQLGCYHPSSSHYFWCEDCVSFRAVSVSPRFGCILWKRKKKKDAKIKKST